MTRWATRQPNAETRCARAWWIAVAYATAVLFGVCLWVGVILS
jgi:hypothetical protein